jgi:hypothetical protein
VGVLLTKEGSVFGVVMFVLTRSDQDKTGVVFLREIIDIFFLWYVVVQPFFVPALYS